MAHHQLKVSPILLSRLGNFIVKYKYACRRSFALTVVAALSQLALSNAALADKQSATAAVLKGLAQPVVVNVNDFRVLGDNPLSAATTSALLKPFLGENRGIDDIESAADVLETKMRKQGLSFYRVSFPPQELSDGVVDLYVSRFTVGKIIVRGNQHYSDKNILASLPQLKKGESPSTKVVARALTLANQNAGKRTRLTFASGERKNEVDATLSVIDQNPRVLSSWLDNTGTDASGDFRVGASLTHRNLFGLDHVASFTFITSPEGINDVQQIAANYRIPVYRWGGSINFFGVKSDIDTGTVGGVFDVAGRGEIFGIGYSQSLGKIGEYRHQWSAQITDKLFDNDIQFQGRQLLNDVRSRPIALSYQGSWRHEKGLQLGGSITATQNLSGGAFNNDQSYADSRIGADNDWSKVDLAANLQYALNSWLYTASASISITNDRLITGEQFAVGGATSVRGLEERELRGDEGARLNFQAWAPSIAKNLRPILFVDAGRVENNQPLESEISSDSVVSAGVIFNWNPIDKVTASMSYGYLIDGLDPVDELSSASRDGDSKVHFNVNYRF